jgi:serine/threonine-protein kinase
VKGKVSYMSPEQIDGRKVDRRADVYAVGVVLYEILTGEKPFAGDDFAGTALLQMLKPPADPRALRSDVSPELASIVLRALEKKPQDRFDTARHMADALLALPSGRAAPRELAEWVADTNRGFFVERGAVISSLPSLEGVLDRVTEPDGPRWSQVPTHVEVVARSAKPGETDRSVEPPTVSRKSFRVAVVGMTLALAAAGVFATLGRASRPKSDGQILKSAPSVAPAVSVSPVESPVAAAPREPALPSSAPPAATAPPATPRAHNATPTDAGSKREAATSPSTPLPDPPCCSGDLRIRFTHCLDNCPAGT